MKNARFTGLASGFVAALLLLVSVPYAWAEDAPRLELKVSSHKEAVKLKDGGEVVERVPVDKAKPGDVLLYAISYTNAGKGEARDASIVDPVPDGTDYVPRSAAGDGAAITCSIDGGKTYQKEPCMREVKKPDGTIMKIEAEPDMYTHIRWVVKSIPPGGSGEVMFKVKVEE